MAIVSRSCELATENASARAVGGARPDGLAGLVSRGCIAVGGQYRMLVPESATRWYVVQCQPHREALAVEELAKQGFTAFSPSRLKSRRHARKITTIRAPFFPGYVFVALDLEKDRWRSVNSTRGVSRLVAFGELPAPVPVGIIDALAERCCDNGVMLDTETMEIGQSVKILAGPFAELIGTLERLDDNGRIGVLLDIMGGRVPVRLAREMVEA